MYKKDQQKAWIRVRAWRFPHLNISLGNPLFSIDFGNIYWVIWWKVLLRCVHIHFIHSVSNSTVDHVEIISINSLRCIWNSCLTKMRCIWHRMLQFRHQTTSTKIKYITIDRVFIKAIDHRIQDRMDKRNMNLPLVTCPWYCGT